MTKEEVYWGSVRFFRHLILLSLAVFMVAETSAIVILSVQNAVFRKELAQAHQVLIDKSLPSVNGAEALSPTTAPSPEVAFAPVLPTYTELYPDFYTEVVVPYSVNTEKTVYLTFDDGPSPRTGEILEILKRYGVKATFFVVGQDNEDSRELMRRIVAEGHELGMHSYTHDYRAVYDSVESCLADYERIFRLIYDATGTKPQVMRYPGGSINGYNGAIYQMVIAEMTRRGFVYFDWNVSADDAVGAKKSAVIVEDNALKNVNSLRRAVVLLHDSEGKTSTVEALPAIIEGYRDAVFTFSVLTPAVVPVIFSYPQ